MPVDAARTRRVSGLLRCLGGYVSSGRDMGAGGGPGTACRTSAAGPVPGPGGWQIAGRVHHRRSRQGPGAPRGPRAADRSAGPARGDPPGVGKGTCAMTDTKIAFVHGRRVWDSRGRPTVEADVLLEGGAVGRAIAPAGASTGSAEALDLRDGGAAFGGYDVTRAVAHVNTEIARAVTGLDATNQAGLDGALIALDGAPAKTRLGANATVAVSMAAAHAAAAAAGQPLFRYLGGAGANLVPLPQIQIFGGGAHAGRRVDIQDFMVMCPAALNFAQALDWTAEVYRAAGLLMRDAGTLAGVADEGGWWPAFATNEQALDALVRAIERAGFRPGEQVGIALDIAASDFGKAGRYKLALEERELGSEDMIRLLEGWIGRYPILSIEDPLAEDDPEGFAAFTRSVGGRVQVVGDDFLVSDAARVRQAAAGGAANTVL